MRLGSLSSELLMCGGGVRSIFLLPLVARCLETIDVCIWRMFVFMSVVVTVWGLSAQGRRWAHYHYHLTFIMMYFLSCIVYIYIMCSSDHIQ